MKISALLTIIGIISLSGCYKPETCDLFIFASHSTEEGVHTVSNRGLKLWSGVSPDKCAEEATRRREKLKGVYLWYGNELTYNELVYCECKN